MRKISTLALALGFIVPLTGCPGDDSMTDTTVATTMPTSTTMPTGGTVDPDSGSAGETMDPTGTTAPSGGFCIHQCEADGDCTVMGMDTGLTCQDGFCTGDAPEGCADDNECIALFSGWSAGPPCTAGGGECEAAMQVCLDVGGEGHCATAPSEFFACADAGFEEIMTQDIDGNDATVCGDPNASCGEDGFCFSPCGSDDDCSAIPSAPVCNTGTGFCECGSDDDCANNMNAATSVCTDGVCGCGEDQNCVDGGVGDVCNDGFCGCSGDAACEGVENTFDGGAIACVEL